MTRRSPSYFMGLLSRMLQSPLSPLGVSGNPLHQRSRQPVPGDDHQQSRRSLPDDTTSRQWQSHQPSGHAFAQSHARDLPAPDFAIDVVRETQIFYSANHPAVSFVPVQASMYPSVNQTP